MTRELKQQYTLRISQANKTQMVVILYEMLLIYVEEAMQAHEQGDKYMAHRYCGAFADIRRLSVVLP